MNSLIASISLLSQQNCRAKGIPRASVLLYTSDQHGFAFKKQGPQAIKLAVKQRSLTIYTTTIQSSE